MFADDKSIENFQQLFFEFKKYLELQKEYTKLELTEKLTILFSTLIMILVLIILGMVALFYLLFALAYILEPLVGGLMSSFAIIAGINVVLIALVIIFCNSSRIYQIRIDGEVNHTFFHVNYDISTYYPWHGCPVLSAFCSCLYIGAFSGRSDVEFRHHSRHQCCSHRPGYYFPQAAHHFSDGELPR